MLSHFSQNYYSNQTKRTPLVASRCSGYHYCTTSFKKARTQVLRRFKPCSRRVRDSRWRGSLTVVPAGNKAKRLSSVNHTTTTIPPHHHHHHHHHHHQGVFYGGSGFATQGRTGEGSEPAHQKIESSPFP